MKQTPVSVVVNPLRIAETEDAETRQNANRKFLSYHENTPEGLRLLATLAGGERYGHPKLGVVVGGVALDNPLMVAAGWDKFGEAVTALHQIGFGGVEVGTVVRDSQPGNPTPRHFTLGRGVMLNRYGFNSPGMHAVKKNLRKYVEAGVPLGINIGKNKDVSLSDAPMVHADVAQELYDEATYFTLGVSSPNTIGLRGQQAKAVLTEIARAVQTAITECGPAKPVFVKIAPDLTPAQVAEVIEVVQGEGLAGIVAANTTADGDIKAKYGEEWRDQMGGLSGDDADYRALCTGMIRFIHHETEGAVPVIGAGGVQDTETALEKIQAGASALQIYTALNFHGPTLPSQINQGLVAFMEKEGVAQVADLVGTALTSKSRRIR